MNEHVRVEIGASAPAALSLAPVPQRLRRHDISRGVIIALVIIVLAGVATAYWTMQGPSVTRYITASVAQGTVARAVSGSGAVNPVLTVIVGTYVSGTIQSISCDFNTKVKKGQLCAKIDPRPYQTLVNQAAANLATARAQLVKDQANLTYGQRKLAWRP